MSIDDIREKTKDIDTSALTAAAARGSGGAVAVGIVAVALVAVAGFMLIAESPSTNAIYIAGGAGVILLAISKSFMGGLDDAVTAVHAQVVMSLGLPLDARAMQLRMLLAGKARQCAAEGKALDLAEVIASVYGAETPEPEDTPSSAE